MPLSLSPSLAPVFLKSCVYFLLAPVSSRCVVRSLQGKEVCTITFLQGLSWHSEYTISSLEMSRMTQADIECKFSASFLSMIGSKIKEVQVNLEVIHFPATYSVVRDQQDHQQQFVQNAEPQTSSQIC